ncbi:hypothetical protein ACFL21_03965, partial [Patescibacteria group bacterium]
LISSEVPQKNSTSEIPRTNKRTLHGMPAIDPPKKKKKANPDTTKKTIRERLFGKKPRDDQAKPTDESTDPQSMSNRKISEELPTNPKKQAQHTDFSTGLPPSTRDKPKIRRTPSKAAIPVGPVSKQAPPPLTVDEILDLKEAKKLAKIKARQEEARRIAEEKLKQEETARLAAEKARVAEEQRRQEEAVRLAAEQVNNKKSRNEEGKESEHGFFSQEDVARLYAEADVEDLFPEPDPTMPELPVDPRAKTLTPDEARKPTQNQPAEIEISEEPDFREENGGLRDRVANPKTGETLFNIVVDPETHRQLLAEAKALRAQNNNPTPPEETIKVVIPGYPPKLMTMEQYKAFQKSMNRRRKPKDASVQLDTGEINAHAIALYQKPRWKRILDITISGIKSFFTFRWLRSNKNTAE